MGRAIADYALLSDCHSAALVSGEGSIDWLCFPRFDSPSVFGRILDAGAGHWSIQPVAEFDVRRRYLPGTLVLETQFTTAQGMVMVTDALLVPLAEGQDLGTGAPHVLVRVAEATEGSVDLVVEYSPRPEYGLVRPHLEAGGDVAHHAVVSVGGGGQMWLSGPPPADVAEGRARWRILLESGGKAGFALQCSSPEDPVEEVWSQGRIERRLDDAVRAWQFRSVDQKDRTAGEALVELSGRVLRGLTYQPTGAIIAAPTTSLPEHAGGTRNWDYRYAWLHPAAATVDALTVAGRAVEAARYVSWILATTGTAGPQPHHVQAVYGVGGEHDLSEREVPRLRGWQHSKPVRLGNASWDQFHIGTFGEIVDAVARAEGQLGVLSESTCAFLADLADAAAMAWQEADAGLWDSRGDLRHHVSSKVLCWVALDRAVGLAERIGRPERRADWAAAREEIRATILDRGWNGRIGAYTQTLDGDSLDASALLLVLTGFLAVDDPRMRATIERIAGDLSAPCGLLYRYAGDAGLGGNDGVFIVCSFWLVQCLAAAGDAARAVELFERAIAYTNDLGLLSEQADPATGALMGNFPHSPTHVGLVNAAAALSALTPEVQTP
ncbi:MAG: glycoside hydrolase family 15 protein [Acidimicrobiia bacterium]|jgi:GH15 family glucan-1,4-alpha-glucosidase|nr:glycoside hydrolase family 15 protein [Acidimicrobiia bacterium]